MRRSGSTSDYDFAGGVLFGAAAVAACWWVNTPWWVPALVAVGFALSSVGIAEGWWE